VIDYLTAVSAQLCVAYIYFDYKAPQNSDANHVMSSLLKQLLGYSRVQVPSGFDAIYEAHIKKGSRPKPSELEEVFNSAVKQLSTFYIVFDAFDECASDQRHAIRNIILHLCTLPNIKIMMTSRPHYNILDQHEFDKFRILEIKADEGDIQKYISRTLENVKQSEGIKKRIMDSLKNRADGTYLPFHPDPNCAQISIDNAPVAVRAQQEGTAKRRKRLKHAATDTQRCI
jgi:hypothetical protein